MVYGRIDWYTAIFNNCSLKQILDKLHIDSTYYDELLSSNYERSLGYTSNFTIDIHGIQFQLKFDEALPHYQVSFKNGDITDRGILKFFDTYFTYIRVDISGTGLEFLRNKFEIDSAMIDEDYFKPLEMHVTRADFAFDFVNEKYNDYFKPLYEHLINESVRNLGSKRISVPSSKTELHFELKSGSQETIYIGSNRSDRYVRIYNKKLQLCPNGIWKDDKIPLAFNEEGKDIDTWFRIEFQCRNNVAMSNLYHCNRELKNILSVMEEYYMFKDKDGEVLPFCQTLYDWTKLQRVIQNAKYSIPRRRLERISNVIQRDFISLYIYIARYGVGQFIELLNSEYIKLHNNLNVSLYRDRAFRKIVADVLTEEGISLSDFKGITHHELSKDTRILFNS